MTGLLERDPKRRIGDAASLAAELAQMSAFRGWRWTTPDFGAVAAASEGPRSPSDVPHAQVLGTMGPRTQPEGRGGPTREG